MKIQNKLNKKADIAVTLFVVMIFILIGLILFRFATKTGSINSGILNARFVESNYPDEGNAVFELNSIGKEAFLDAYEKTKNSISSPNFNLLLEQKILENLKAIYSNIDYESLKINVDEKKVEISYYKSLLYKEVLDKEGRLIAFVRYYPLIIADFYFEDYGLAGYKSVKV